MIDSHTIQQYNPSSSKPTTEGGLLMKLIPDGAYVICNKNTCGSHMDLAKEVCPKCNGTKCYIVLRWKPKGAKGQQATYYYRRDDNNKPFRCVTAIEKLTEIGKAMKADRFNPETLTDAAIAERRFENQFTLFSAEMKDRYDAGDWSYGHYANLKTYGEHYYHWFDSKDVTQIELQTLKQFLKSIKGKKSKTRKNVLGMLHKFFSWLFDNGTIPNIPAFPEITGGDEARRSALRQSEQVEGLNNIMSAVPSKFDNQETAMASRQVVRDIIELMSHTGVRHSEVIAILVKSIDLEERCIWIERVRDGYKRYVERTKNREKLPVPLNDTALSIVAKYVKDKLPNSFLFINPRTGRPFSKWTIWDTWKRLSGTDVCSYEATRHSFCSQVRSKVPAPIGQRLMRHKDATSTNRYYHEWSENLVDAVKKIDTAKVIPLEVKQK